MTPSAINFELFEQAMLSGQIPDAALQQTMAENPDLERWLIERARQRQSP